MPRGTTPLDVWRGPAARRLLHPVSLNRDIARRIERPEDKRAYVRDLFAGVAHRYDLTNDVLSLGLHRRWKRRLLELADIRAGQTVLDLAAGTGDLARGAIEAAGGDLAVVAADLTPEMMRVGTRRKGPALDGWIAADAGSLPFADGRFDRVLIGYGLRNFARLERCLAEVLRCLKPGGRLVALDFGHPPHPGFGRAYRGYLEVATRAVGWALHRDAESYVYILESLRRFPGQRGVQRLMEEVGYARAGFEDLWFGTMGINYGERPEAGG